MPKLVTVDEWAYNIEHVSIAGKVDGVRVATTVKVRPLRNLLEAWERDPAEGWPRLKTALARELAMVERPQAAVNQPDAVLIED